MIDAAFYVPVIVYLASIFCFSAYLRKHHNEVWQSLGSFSFSNWGIGNANRMGSYVMFRGAYRKLNDKMASRYILVIRALMIVVLIPFFFLSLAVLTR